MKRGKALLQAGGDLEGSAQHTELSVLVYHFLKVTWAACTIVGSSAADPFRSVHWNLRKHALMSTSTS